MHLKSIMLALGLIVTAWSRRLSKLPELALRLGLIGLGGLSTLPVTAHAQTAVPPGQASLYVHTIEETPATFPNTAVPALQVQVTFSAYDAQGSVIKGDMKNGALDLEAISYTGLIGRVQGDASIVLLIDTSLTMASATAAPDFQRLLQRTNAALGSAPENANFAVLTFNDRVQNVQDFTRDRDGLAKQISALKAKPNSASCLNDGLYESILKLRGAPGRRAVVALTASADNCASRNLESVVAFARDNDVQIYSVGLQGYTMLPQDLEFIANETGGRSMTRTAGDANFALEYLLGILRNQWTATWYTFPTQGEHPATMSVTLPDSTSVPYPLTITSDQNYEAPPEVVIVGKAQSTLTEVRFNLEVANSKGIDSVVVTVVSKETGRVVVETTLPELTDSVAVPADGLTKGSEYSLTIVALDANGELLAQATSEAFRYEPTPPTLTITTADVPTVVQSDFVITVTAENLTSAVRYEVWLEAEQQGGVVPGTKQSFVVGETLTIPGADVPSGNYVVRVQALDNQEAIVANAEPLKIVYRQPGLIERMVYGMRQSPLAIAAVTVVGCLSVLGLGVLGWFLMPKGNRVKNVEMALPEKVRRAAPAPAPLPVAQKPAPAARPLADPAPPPPGAQPAVKPSVAEAPRPIAKPPAPEATAPVSNPSPHAAPDQPTMVMRRPSLQPATLQVIEPSGLSFKTEVRKTPFSVGRRNENDAALPVEGKSGVSGQHCTFIFREGQWYVQDDKSTYGTTVNGEKVAKGQAVRVDDSAVIGLGPYVKVQFQLKKE